MKNIGTKGYSYSFHEDGGVTIEGTRLTIRLYAKANPDLPGTVEVTVYSCAWNGQGHLISCWSGGSLLMPVETWEMARDNNLAAYIEYIDLRTETEMLHIQERAHS